MRMALSPGTPAKKTCSYIFLAVALLGSLFSSDPAIYYDCILYMDLSTRLNFMTTEIVSYLHLYSQWLSEKAKHLRDATKKKKILSR